MGKIVAFTRALRPNSTGFAVDGKCSQNIVLLCITAYTAIVAMYAFMYPASLSGKSYVLTSIAIVPVIIGMMYSNSIAPFGEFTEKTILAWIIAMGIVIYLGVMSYSTPINIQLISVSSLGFNIVVICIALVSLAAIFTMFSNYLRTLQNVPRIGIFFRIFFFIPCLISDAIAEMKTHFQLTTRPVLILFAIDLLLILIYAVAPYISRMYGKHTILDKVVYLDQKNVLLKDFTSLRYIYTPSNNNNNDPTYKIQDIYAIGFWIFVSPKMTANEMQINIFKFGNVVSMVYNSSTGLYEFNLAQYTNGSAIISVPPQTISSTEIIPQAWNYIVFNYTEVSAEIFVNGVISRAIQFGGTDSRGAYTRTIYNTTYTQYDITKNTQQNSVYTYQLIVGAENGLYGAIHGVEYYPNSLTSSQIAGMYAYARLFALPEIPV